MNQEAFAGNSLRLSVKRTSSQKYKTKKTIYNIKNSLHISNMQRVVDMSPGAISSGCSM